MVKLYLYGDAFVNEVNHQKLLSFLYSIFNLSGVSQSPRTYIQLQLSKIY